MRDAAVLLHGLLMGPSMNLVAFVVPLLLAWLGVRAAQALFARMERDPVWLASAAAAALCAPGALACWYALHMATDGFLTAPPMPWWHDLLSDAPPLVAVALIARAAVRFAARVVEAAQLRRSTIAPSERLAQAAARCGMAARELPNDDAVCFLIGIVRPLVVVSSGTLARLDDAQLTAALLHERAHRRRHDVLCAAVVAFFLDCAPLPLGTTLETYYRARELAADRSTARETTPETLATALMVFARAALRSPAGVHAAALGETAALPARLQALLVPQPDDAAVPARRAAVALLLAALPLLVEYRVAAHAAGMALMRAYGIM